MGTRRKVKELEENYTGQKRATVTRIIITGTKRGLKELEEDYTDQKRITGARRGLQKLEEDYRKQQRIKRTSRGLQGLEELLLQNKKGIKKPNISLLLPLLSMAKEHYC